MKVVQVLVVEDFAPFRRFICSMLAKYPNLHVIGEASDGMEAVRKAEQSRPNLILLDVGLPTVSGLEAARRIRKLSPESKILFVSQETSADIVQEAFRIGAMGYLVKTHAGSELLAAVEAVCEGRRCVSGGLVGGSIADATSREARLSIVPPTKQIPRNHQVQFSSDDASFLSGLSHFVEAALGAEHPVVFIATESHRNSLLESLQAKGLNIGKAIEEGRYIPLDAADTLSTFMVNDLPDPVRFLKVAGDLLAAAANAEHGKRSRVAACGECAPYLWAQGNADAAIRLEHLWDEVARTHDVDILCGYLLNSDHHEQGTHTYKRICAAHSLVCSQ